jgi:hypothetical protein
MFQCIKCYVYETLRKGTTLIMCGLMDTVKMYLKKISYEDMEWIKQAQNGIQ